MADLGWVSPLDQQRARHESSAEIRTRAATMRQYGHWGLAQVLEDEADRCEMWEGKVAQANHERHAELVVCLPRAVARLVAAEARESSKLRPQYAALAGLSEAIYEQLRS
jgi:hypothetical protein